MNYYWFEQYLIHSRAQRDSFCYDRFEIGSHADSKGSTFILNWILGRSDRKEQPSNFILQNATPPKKGNLWNGSVINLYITPVDAVILLTILGALFGECHFCTGKKIMVFDNCQLFPGVKLQYMWYVILKLHFDCLIQWPFIIKGSPWFQKACLSHFIYFPKPQFCPVFWLVNF